ncbi:RICIN domain-containing protein [Streptomyces sp. NPDC008343]|uniref:RICIN domain-containing protein n=1 Tax=Streptomyces sp. NPDC008343 TaxID=3364828 RepID=UPI0036E246E0
MSGKISGETGQVGGYYRLVARHSGKCLDVQAAATANGARLLQWPCGAGKQPAVPAERGLTAGCTTIVAMGTVRRSRASQAPNSA